MDILIVDRDEAAVEALQSLLEGEGHNVVHETVRKTAQERLNSEHFDVIFIDPAPLPSVREFSLPLRWEQREKYFYLVLTGHDVAENDVARSGMNARLEKPFTPQSIRQVLDNASRLINFMDRLRGNNVVPSDSRIFAQRSFYQLILSALDRAYRYHEQAFLLAIRISNLETMVAQAGKDMTAQLVQGLGNFLSRLHRLSDFLGNTNEDEYMLLILRPAADTEPQDAVDRFETALQDFQDQVALRIKPNFELSLWALPGSELVLKKELFK